MGRFCTLLVFVPLLAAGAAAGGPGTTSANFLKIPVGARESALGGAFTAVADGPGAVFYNPAGLSQVDTLALGYSYNNYFSGISQHTAGVVSPRGGGAWGLGLNYLQVGAFPSYDAQDKRTGEVSAYGAAVSLGYGAPLWGGARAYSLRCGAAVKYVTENLDGTGADGAALDAGLLFSGPGGLRLGAAAENAAATRMDFSGAGGRPARKVKAGAAYAFGAGGASGLISAELDFPEDGAGYFAAGLEGALYGSLFARAGYSGFGGLSNGLSFGLGLKAPERFGSRVRFDYSFGSTYDLGNIHRFGLSYAFDKLPGGALTEALVKEEVRADPDAGFAARIEALYGADPSRAGAAAEALAADCGPRVVEHFSAMLGSGRLDWQLASLRGLARCAAAGAPGVIARALRDEKPEVRRRAAAALGERGGTEAARALELALKGEESEEVKGALLEALGRAGRP